MEKLYQIFTARLKSTDTKFIRYLYRTIAWNNRLIAIKGARGVGKTTLILQYIKKNFKIDQSVLYVSLDNLWFQENKLFDLAGEFVRNGGKNLFIDEVHKYPNWSVEIKNIYDSYPELKIVFTGSSLLEILRGKADLSRRVVIYELNGLSFKEFLEYEEGIKIQNVSMEYLFQDHITIANDLLEKTGKPIVHFKEYLKYGYYPYYKEDKATYYHRLGNVINLILESDIPSVHQIEIVSVSKMKKLLSIIAGLVPFKPNISKISEKIFAGRVSTLQFLDYLEKARVLNKLYSSSRGISLLSKPDKIYLNNTNIAYSLAYNTPDIGNIRETFLFNQLLVNHKVNYTDTGDFLIDDIYTIEVGGRNKTNRQIKGIKNAYIAADSMEVGYKNKIPLWMFGLEY